MNLLIEKYIEMIIGVWETGDRMKKIIQKIPENIKEKSPKKEKQTM
jgi:hypothetical protein